MARRKEKGAGETHDLDKLVLALRAWRRCRGIGSTAIPLVATVVAEDNILAFEWREIPSESGEGGRHCDGVGKDACRRGDVDARLENSNGRRRRGR